MLKEHISWLEKIPLGDKKVAVVGNKYSIL